MSRRKAGSKLIQVLEFVHLSFMYIVSSLWLNSATHQVSRIERAAPGEDLLRIENFLTLSPNCIGHCPIYPAKTERPVLLEAAV